MDLPRTGQLCDPSCGCCCPHHHAASLCTLDAVQASAKVTVQPSGSIRLSDVQQLLLWTLADGVSPKWAFIEACVLREYVILGHIPRAFQ